jgi:hypothetical protein
MFFPANPLAGNEKLDDSCWKSYNLKFLGKPLVLPVRLEKV